MATTQWVANAQSVSQVVTITVTGVAVGGTLVATINGKNIVYTCVVGDTIATAVTAWLALLSAAATTPAEFAELSWASPTASTITATASVPGTPFAGMTGGLTTSATGGATLTQTATTPNQSPSDIIDPRNWLRNGVAALPQTGDDVIVANSDTPLLWNLAGLGGVLLNSYTRWQSFTATIGLPEINENGYLEFRPTYLKLAGASSSSSSSSVSGGGAGSVFNMLLGYGPGSGPGRERYDVGTTQTNVIVLAAGAALDDYSIRLLGTNVANTLTVMNTSVGVAALPAETASLASAQVDGGGLLSLGTGVTFGGTLTLTGGAAQINCAIPTIVAQQGSQIAQGTQANALVLNYPSVVLKGGSSATWLSGSNVTTLTLQTSSVFDKSGSLAPMTVGTLSLEVDSCSFLDPFSSVTFTQPVVLVNALQTGPFAFAAGRTFRIT